MQTSLPLAMVSLPREGLIKLWVLLLAGPGLLLGQLVRVRNDIQLDQGGRGGGRGGGKGRAGK